MGVGRVAGDLEDPVILDERVTPDRLALAGDPDHMGVAPADHPPPVVLGPDDRSGGPGVLLVVKPHQVVQFDLAPGADVPEPALALDHAVGHLGQVPAEGLAEALPAADPPPQRAVELGHPGVERLEGDAGLAGPAVGQPHQVLGVTQAPVFGQGPDPDDPVHRELGRPVADLAVGQVDVADDPAVDLDQQALLGLVGRVAERAEEALAVGPLEDVQERLVDRFMIGLAAEAELDRTATIRQPDDRLGHFHRWTTFGRTATGPEPASRRKGRRPSHVVSPHCRGSVAILPQLWGGELAQFFRGGQRPAARSIVRAIAACDAPSPWSGNAYSRDRATPFHLRPARSRSRSASRVSRWPATQGARSSLAWRIALSRSDRSRRVVAVALDGRPLRREGRPGARGRGLGQVAVRVVREVADRPFCRQDLRPSGGITVDPEPLGQRERQEARRLDPEEPAGQLVAQLVVLGPADPVHEQVAEQVAGEQRGRQGPGPEPDPQVGGRPQVFDSATGVAIGVERELEERLVLAADPQLASSGRAAGPSRGGGGGTRPARPRTGLRAIPPAGPAQGPGGSCSGSRKRPGSGPGPRCGSPGTAGAAARRWQANQPKASVSQTSPIGTSRFLAPHSASTSRRASANRRPTGRSRRARRRTLGQNESSRGSATRSPRVARARSAKLANNASSRTAWSSYGTRRPDSRRRRSGPGGSTVAVGDADGRPFGDVVVDDQVEADRPRAVRARRRRSSSPRRPGGTARAGGR